MGFDRQAAWSEARAEQQQRIEAGKQAAKATRRLESWLDKHVKDM